MVANAAKENEVCTGQDSVKRSLHKGASCEAQLEIDKLEAKIAAEQARYMSKPKIRYIGTRAKDADMALYMNAWRRKVEKFGNDHYSKEARNKKIYGKVKLTTLIRSDGTIEKIQLNKSSGYKVLDRHALSVVRGAAPYMPFKESLKKKADILGITRTFTYMHK